MLSVLLEAALAELFQLSTEAVAQWAFGPQLVQQGLRLFKNFVVQLTVAEQLLPASADLLFGKHLNPRRKKQKYKTDLPVRGESPRSTAILHSSIFFLTRNDSGGNMDLFQLLGQRIHRITDLRFGMERRDEEPQAGRLLFHRWVEDRLDVDSPGKEGL